MMRSLLRSRAILVACAALLHASGARAFTTVHADNPKWPGATMTYHVNATSFTSAGLSVSAVNSAYAAWQGDPVATIVCVAGSNTNGTGADDGSNDVYFEDTNWTYGTGVLAVTYFQWVNPGGLMTEADIIVNGDDYAWTTNPAGGCTTAYDLQATVAHEAGHAIGIGHSSESQSTCNPGSGSFDPVLCDATMYFSGGPCDPDARSLECDDRAAVRFLYPPGGTARADWTTSGFVASPSGGNVTPGQPIAITGSALNVGSLATSAGLSGLYVSTTPSLPGGGATTTQALASANPCRTRDVSFNHAFTAGDAGTRYLLVKLDNGNTTTELDESDASNVVALGPFTIVAGPALEVAPPSLTFNATVGGANPATQAVTVTNGGGGTFTWSATDNRTWLSVSPASGAPGASFTVSVNTTGLAAGSHPATITVTAAGATGSPATIPVTLDLVAGPVLSVTPAAMTFNAAPGGALPPSQPLSISNAGGGTLSWTVSDNATWLALSPGSGTNAGTVTVSVTSTGMPAGSYPATITVAAGSAEGAPASIPVTLNLSTAILTVTPTSLGFSGPVGGSAPPSQQISVTNTGTGTLSFTATSNRSWLSVAPGSASAPSTLTIGVNPAGLGAGAHSGAVTVSAPGAGGSPATIPVTYTLSLGPSIATSPTSMSFASIQGGTAPSQSLTIRNDGAGTLNYTVSDNATWLAVTAASGSLTAGSSRAHTVTANAAGLPVGQQSATITIADPAADDSPRSVAVTLDVTASPPLSVSPPTLAFSATPSAPTPPVQSVAITTGGSPAATWTATSDQAWLSATPSSGAGDASVSIAASSSGLAAGTHPATLTITAPSLSASPRTVAVTFTVAAGPRLAVSATTASWSAPRNGPLPPATSASVTNAGTGSLSWSVSGAPSWLQVTPLSGAAPGSFSMQPTRTDLAAGRYTGTLSVSAAGAYDSPRELALSYDVVGPAVTLAPERVAFEIVAGTAISPTSVNVDLVAGGAWTARSNRAWIGVSPTSGSGNATLVVSLQQASLMPVGLFDGAVVVSQTGASNSPAPLPVVLRKRPAPALSAFPQQLDLDAAAGTLVQAAGMLAIDEAGDGTGEWTVVSAPAWLRPSAMAGSHGATIDLAVDPTGLSSGAHAGTLRIGSEGSTLDLPATLVVRSAPGLELDRPAIDLIARAGTVSSAESLVVTNVGAAPSSFTVTASQPWLRASGALVAPSTLAVSADASALAAGEHDATLTVRAGSSTAACAVRLVVVGSGAPVADFAASPAAGCATLTVSLDDLTVGAGTHQWTFEGAGTSSLAEPTAAFTTPGEREISLTVSNASGASTRRRSVTIRQPPLAFAGLDRLVAFEADGQTRVVLDGARVAAAAPARVASLRWTTSAGTFEDSGTTTSSLERPTLILASGRGGMVAALRLDVTDDAGCSATDQAFVAVLTDLDADGDGSLELLDNCPGLANASQADFDGDGAGDPCDGCPTIRDDAQIDANANGIGDACDPAFAPSLALASTRARACEGVAGVDATITLPAPIRRAGVVLAGRAASGARASSHAQASGGTAWIDAGDPLRVQLRVPAGMRAGGDALVLELPLQPSDQLVPVDCASSVLGFVAGERGVSCADGSIDLRADGDVAPAAGPDGRVDVSDVVRLLRAAVLLDELTADELARGDLSPGADVAGVWRAMPDCSLDVADVVVALRASVGLVVLP